MQLPETPSTSPSEIDYGHVKRGDASILTLSSRWFSLLTGNVTSFAHFINPPTPLAFAKPK